MKKKEVRHLDILVKTGKQLKAVFAHRTVECRFEVQVKIIAETRESLYNNDKTVLLLKLLFLH